MDIDDLHSIIAKGKNRTPRGVRSARDRDLKERLERRRPNGGPKRTMTPKELKVVVGKVKSRRRETST